MHQYQLVTAFVIVILLAGITCFYIWVQIRRREETRRKQELLDNTDELTQISNKKYIDDMLEKELDRSRRHGNNLGFIIIEIDNFEDIIESYGQQFSKRVLKETAENLQEKIRAYDVLARHKKQFLCLFPETNMEAVLLLSKRARAVVEAETYYFRIDGDPIHVTASIGATSCNPGTDTDITITMIKDTARRALAEAKKKGSNRVEFMPAGSNN